MSIKTSCFGLHFCRRKLTYIFNHLRSAPERQISRLSPIRVAFDVKRRSPTLFPVLPKPEVVLTAKRWQIGPYIVLKSNRKSGIARVRLCGFRPFLLPVWPETAIGGLFLPITRCVVADDRNTTSGWLEVNKLIRCRRSPEANVTSITVRPMLEDRCPVCLTVTLVYCG